jgi:hypothetical protein
MVVDGGRDNNFWIQPLDEANSESIREQAGSLEMS